MTATDSRNSATTDADLDEQTRLAALAARAGDELDAAPATEILAWAAEQFGSKWCVASSMADAVLPHLAASVAPGVDVVFLDTGYHFAETIGTRDAVAATMQLNLITVTPKRTVAEQDAEFGPCLYERDPDLCCAMRKVAPLADALEPYTAWASGLRRDEASTRHDVRVVEWDAKRSMVKLNPIAAWTEDDVQRYIADNGVLVNPLLFDGYGSVGCAPCTRRLLEGEDARAGRWAGLTKTECGLHT
ncbi:phosphoadenosine phosphosulfate reductase [Frankineae bacterium MT45]|nr:phosphoadenosine phosphosulfate reductase [Frankineae bacterium MT45]